MKSTTTITLLLSLIGPAFATSNPEITAPAVLPDVLARQLSTTIVGYFTRNGSWNSVWCNAGWRYCTQGSYAACGTITENACNVGISCISTSLYVDTRGVTSTCSFGNDTVCGTNTVYQSPGDPTPITSIVCRAAGSAGLAVYRNFPNTGLSSSSSRASSAASTSISSTLATSTSSTSTSASSAPISDGGGPSKSKAWIAGPVIGGLVVLAAFIFGFILLRRRKAKKTALQQAPPMQHHQPPPVGYAPGPEKTPAVGSHPQQYGYSHSPQPYGSPPQQYGYPQQGYPQSPPAQYAHEYAQPAQLPAQQQPVYELGPRQ